MLVAEHEDMLAWSRRQSSQEQRQGHLGRSRVSQEVSVKETLTQTLRTGTGRGAGEKGDCEPLESRLRKPGVTVTKYEKWNFIYKPCRRKTKSTNHEKKKDQKKVKMKIPRNQ